MFHLLDFSDDVFYDGAPDVSVGISNITGATVNRPDNDMTEILNKGWVYLPFRWEMTVYDIVCSESGIVSFEEKEFKPRSPFLKALLDFEQQETPELCVCLQNLNKCFDDAGKKLMWFEPPYIEGENITLVLLSDNKEDCLKFTKKIRWKHPEKLTVVYREQANLPVNIPQKPVVK